MKEQISEDFAKELLREYSVGFSDQYYDRIILEWKEKGFIKKSALDEARDMRENIHHKIEDYCE
jgi:hypothetical protein